MGAFIEIIKIVTPVLLTGVITFLITRYTCRRNIPLDKMQIAYDRVYFPIYCLLFDDTDENIDNIIKESKKYLNKYRKYVDKSTILAFNNLQKNYEDLKYDKSLYENYKLNIFSLNSSLRKRLGYLEASIFNMYRVSTLKRRYAIRIMIYILFGLSVCYIISLLQFAWSNKAIFSIVIIWGVVFISESTILLFRVVWRKIKKWYLKHKGV